MIKNKRIIKQKIASTEVVIEHVKLIKFKSPTEVWNYMNKERECNPTGAIALWRMEHFPETINWYVHLKLDTSHFYQTLAELRKVCKEYEDLLTKQDLTKYNVISVYNKIFMPKNNKLPDDPLNFYNIKSWTDVVKLPYYKFE